MGWEQCEELFSHTSTISE